MQILFLAEAQLLLSLHLVSVPLKEPDCFTLIYAEELILGDCHLDVEKVIISKYQLYFLADVVAGFLLMRLVFNWQLLAIEARSLWNIERGIDNHLQLWFMRYAGEPRSISE